jgi:glycosyltransferase involved in cell wall biosynthesis
MLLERATTLLMIDLNPNTHSGRRLRLAHVITGLELGGGGAVVLTIARALDRTRFDMDVFCIFEGGDGEQELRDLGCGVTIIEGAWDYRRRFLPYSPSRTLKLASMLKAGRYDVVHTHLFQADAIGRVAARLAGIPVMVKSLHNMGQWKKGRHVLTDRLLGRWTDKTICCSHFQREVACAQESIAADAAVTIHHGVRMSRFQPRIDRESLLRSLGLRPDWITIGTVGRNVTEKGQSYLIEALPTILLRHPNVQLLVVGDGHLRATLQARIAALGYQDRVCLAGARPDIPEMLALMDVFAFPSVSEGFGIAVIEAMATGLPVVASDIRPLSEIVVPGETGFLVAPRDPAAIANAIVALLDDRSLRDRLGVNGREHVVQNFTDRKMVQAHEDLYVNLHRNAAARRGQVPSPIPCH